MKQLITAPIIDSFFGNNFAHFFLFLLGYVWLETSHVDEVHVLRSPHAAAN
jgi:hypothetical protein